MLFQPLIKWIGSKRSQSEEILNYFPTVMDTYYEPFCGGCSMLYQLLNSKDHYVGRYVVSDINSDLIDMLDIIKRNPNRMYFEYTKLWNGMHALESRQDKKRYYEKIRRDFNKSRSPYLFFFLMRTCTNGIPRYNRNGDFNNTFHITREGVLPSRLKNMIFKWSKLFNENNVEFICCDYRQIFDRVGPGDFLYLDPPYKMDRSTGKYFGKIDHTDLFDRLCVFKELGYRYCLSYDGPVGCAEHVPESCYDMKVEISSKNGGYSRTALKESPYSSELLYVN